MDIGRRYRSAASLPHGGHRGYLAVFLNPLGSALEVTDAQSPIAKGSKAAPRVTGNNDA